MPCVHSLQALPAPSLPCTLSNNQGPLAMPCGHSWWVFPVPPHHGFFPHDVPPLRATLLNTAMHYAPPNPCHTPRMFPVGAACAFSHTMTTTHATPNDCIPYPLHTTCHTPELLPMPCGCSHQAFPVLSSHGHSPCHALWLHATLLHVPCATPQDHFPCHTAAAGGCSHCCRSSPHHGTCNPHHMPCATPRGQSSHHTASK